MSLQPPYAPRRFLSTAPYYRHRAPYPDRLIRRVAERCGLKADSARVLDLGCGPGVLAIALAPFCKEAVGVDPEPTMLAQAAANARAACVHLTLAEGSSFALPAGLGRFRLVVIGRAFHWMDRAATLADLDRLIEPEGAVALFGERSLAVAENRWRAAFEAVTARYTFADDAVYWDRHGPGWPPHEHHLLASPFADLERLGRVYRQELTVADLVGRALSRSSTAPAVLGKRRAAFEQELQEQLAPFADAAGLLPEIVEAEVLIARRSSVIPGPS